MGVILYDWVVGDLPFGEGSSSFAFPVEAVQKADLSPELCFLLKRMLCEKDDQRATTDEISESKWITKRAVKKDFDLGEDGEVLAPALVRRLEKERSDYFMQKMNF